jgi:CheY-like chemotaxis protein
VPKLLLADDSPTTQKVVQLTFADEGIEVVIADDGDSAMELFAHHRPDIVLADINMPGLNGYEVCEAIRKRADYGATPVILLAGSFEPFDVELAHRVGANDYLTKPFASIRRLVATVTALLDTSTRHDSAAEETVEPNSVPPHVPESEAEPVAELESELEAAPSAEPQQQPESVPAVEQSPENAPGPSLPPEPDMYATDDIENLISQSFVETVEMPHTVVERVLSEISSQKADQPSDQPASQPDDVAFDDELIETTFANEPDGSIIQSQPVQDESPVDERSWETVSPISFESGNDESSQNGNSTAAAEHREEPLGEAFAPPHNGFAEAQTEQSEPTADINTAELRLAPTEEFQIDQSGDEAYFEPAAESIDENGEVQSTQFEEAAWPVGENVGAEEPDNYQEPPANEVEHQAEQRATEPEIGDESSAEFTEPESAPAEEHVPAPTPWESVAEPQPARFSLDESNLLELPIGFGGRSGQTTIEPENEFSPMTAAIAPEVVDAIARATASQISEELVREIAQRIVPKVIEEVMARRKSENINE